MKNINFTKKEKNLYFVRNYSVGDLYHSDFILCFSIRKRQFWRVWKSAIPNTFSACLFIRFYYKNLSLSKNFWSLRNYCTITKYMRFFHTLYTWRLVLGDTVDWFVSFSKVSIRVLWRFGNIDPCKYRYKVLSYFS